jgi:hypothetical protein
MDPRNVDLLVAALANHRVFHTLATNILLFQQRKGFWHKSLNSFHTATIKHDRISNKYEFEDQTQRFPI